MKSKLQTIILLVLCSLLPLSMPAAAAATPSPADDTAGLGLKVSLGDVRQLKLLGFIQSHYDVCRIGNTTTDDFNIKRAIFMADARLTRQLSFWLMVDAAAPTAPQFMHEYYAQYAFSPALKLRIGQFKQPFTLENIKPIFFLNEVNMNESIRYFAGVQGDPLYGNYAGRDLGAMLTGDICQASDGHHWLSYYAGIFNGAGMNRRDNNTHKDFIAMLNVNLSSLLTLSTSCLFGHGSAQAPSPFNTLAVGQTYRRQRWSAGLEWRSRTLNVRGEWVEGLDAAVRSRGGYAELCIHTIPRLDVVLDADYLDRNTALTSADCTALGTPARSVNYTIGLQYWVHHFCRVATQYIYSDRDTFAPAHQWVTQFQIVF